MMKEESYLRSDYMVSQVTVMSWDMIRTQAKSFYTHIKKTGRTKLSIFCSVSFPVSKAQELDLEDHYPNCVINYTYIAIYSL